MIKRKRHSSNFDVHKAIIHKLNRKQIFWLCVLALIVLGIVAVFAPTALVGLL